jgi:hypothetical protein
MLVTVPINHVFFLHLKIKKKHDKTKNLADWFKGGFIGTANLRPEAYSEPKLGKHFHGNSRPHSGRAEKNLQFVLDGGPSSATFEYAKAITRFIQRFGTRVN